MSFNIFSLSKDIVKFNSQTQSRDKIFRTVQYASKLVAWQLAQGSKDGKAELITRLTKLEATLSLSRKLFRMGNFVDLLHKTANAFSTKGTALKFLSVVAQFMKAVWLFLDHIIWFGKVGLVQIDIPHITKLSLRAWLVSLISATLVDFIKIDAVHTEIAQFRKAQGKDASLPADLQTSMHSARLNFWRDFCDVFIPLGGLQYVNPGFSALTGVISSLIGFRLEWERVISPFKPKSS